MTSEGRAVGVCCPILYFSLTINPMGKFALRDGSLDLLIAFRFLLEVFDAAGSPSIVTGGRYRNGRKSNRMHKVDDFIFVVIVPYRSRQTIKPISIQNLEGVLAVVFYTRWRDFF